MKRALVICSRVPYPPYSGAQIRMMNNIRILAESYKVDVVCFGVDQLKDEVQTGILRFASTVHYFKVRRIGYFLNLVRGFLSSRNPFQVSLYFFPKIARWIHLHASGYDLFFCMHIRTAEYVKDLSTGKKAIDYVDSISMNYRNLNDIVKGPKALLYKIESKRVLEYELRCSRRFDFTMITSGCDRASLEVEGATGIEVVPHFVDNISAGSLVSPSLLLQNPFLLFLGKMDYEPNVNAVLYFCDGIFQKIREAIPELRLYIVGNRPSSSVRDLEQIPGVIVTGFVDSVLPYIEACKIVIAPMVSGSGVQTKILEAMRMGKCVVTTAKGADGLAGLSGMELVIADGKANLAAEIIALVHPEGDERRQRIGDNAYEYFKKTYSYDIVRNKMLKSLEKLWTQTE